MTRETPPCPPEEPTATGKAKRQRARPRAPSQGRGVARFEVLLDATEALLREHSPDDVGMYQIAEAAEVPPASVYHFFPTKEAAFVGLVRRYLEGFAERSRQGVDIATFASWQDLMRYEQGRARAFFGEHPPALKLLYGGYGGLESRKLDSEFTSTLADNTFARYDRVFHMPYLTDAAAKFRISWAIMDAIWSLSYLKEGRITDDYAEEALAACYAYCRLFLPERVEMRQEMRDLVARGETLVLAIG